MTAVTARGLKKTYMAGDVAVEAIRGVDFDVQAGSFAAFVGPSGSGKSTLLNMIGCLDRPTAGRLTVAGTDVGGFDRKQAAAFRATTIGFIFQDFNLLPVLTAYENIEYVLDLKAKTGEVAYDRLVMRVDKTALVPTTIEAHAASGMLIKTLRYSEVKDLGDGVPRPARLETDSPLYRGYVSVMLTARIKPRSLPDEAFTLNALPRLGELRQ